MVSGEDLPTPCEPTKQTMEGSNTPNEWPGIVFREQLYDRAKDEITLSEVGTDPVVTFDS